jgi:hypothetical protein
MSAGWKKRNTARTAEQRAAEFDKLEEAKKTSKAEHQSKRRNVETLEQADIRRVKEADR